MELEPEELELTELYSHLPEIERSMIIDKLHHLIHRLEAVKPATIQTKGHCISNLNVGPPLKQHKPNIVSSKVPNSSQLNKPLQGGEDWIKSRFLDPGEMASPQRQQSIHQPDKYLRRRKGAHEIEPKTDLTRWRLSTVEGRQGWYYVADNEECAREQNAIEAYTLGLDTSKFFPDVPKASTAQEALWKAIPFFSGLQAEDGHWPMECSGVLSLAPGLLFACYGAKILLPEEVKKELLRYILSKQLPDGGWGLHLKEQSTVVGTAFNYIAMRILGLGPDHPDVVRARINLHKKGGALGIPHLGKVWLAVMNLYSWEGMNSPFPELWLLSTWIPGHPSTFWCHTRHITLVMCYCYATRLTVEEDELIQSLRQEIYVEDFSSIDWPAHRNNVAETDLQAPHSWMLDAAYATFNWYERYHFTSLRKKAIAEMQEQIKADDIFSNYTNSSPICKSFHVIICWYVDGANSPALQEHISRIYDYLWLGQDGMLMKVMGSQTWDASFTVQGFLEAGVQNNPDYESCLKKAHVYLKASQIVDNPPNYQRYYRQMNKGGFPFSYRENDWIVSDCTAEAMRVLMLLEEKCPFIEDHVAPQRLFDAVNVMLNMRNSNGGFSSYETRRGSWLPEIMNSSESYADCMVDHTYTECTSSVMQALRHFEKRFPHHRVDEISDTLIKGLQYCRDMQKADGSWLGNWGVCFTYGTWFALEAFACMGYIYHHGVACKEVTKGCEFLVSKQMKDGGWGEEFESYKLCKYIQHTVSQIHHTAWALLGLMAVGYPDVRVLERGIKVLIDKQTSIGDSG
ncbi:lanosterol synthase-like isoform X2 [Rhineura floridana]|uniref:lanosterol synthase-like isoform X2 n=1 Tax=Rhineura floridana TaxID=261503 RepID=UPI002AC85CA5|nr:lanosterol synthase-like isoform X2 [Rhineura floridana]